MVEFAVDQGLADVGGGLAVHRTDLAHRDLRYVAHIAAPEIHTWIRANGISGPDVQGRREGMITNVWRIVARAARSLKHGNAAGDQAAGRHVVVYSRDAGDVNGFGIEDGLAARDGCSQICRWQCRPGIEDVEDRRAEHTVARRHEPTRLLELWQ